jgi:Rieske Fe-S protein
VDRGPTAVGDASGWLPGNFGAVDGTRIAVGRDEAGFWALSLTCTHLACNIAHEGSVDWNGIRCACHGSRFGRDGDVVFGPAVRDLRNYAVSIGEDGQLIVDTASDVPLGTRTPGESA